MRRTRNSLLCGKKVEYDAQGLKPVDGVSLPYQAEKTAEKTDQILYSTYGRSNPVIQPYDVVKIKRNTIGQQNWASAGMAITYEVVWGLSNTVRLCDWIPGLDSGMCLPDQKDDGTKPMEPGEGVL